MTKTDGGAMAARGMELKKELWRLVKEIVDEDDYMVETADQAITTLCSLKYLKQSNNTLSFKLDDHAFTVPQEFRCPISKELMKDPVVLATGQVLFFSCLFCFQLLICCFNFSGLNSVSICMKIFLHFNTSIECSVLFCSVVVFLLDLEKALGFAEKRICLQVEFFGIKDLTFIDYVPIW